MSAEDSTVVPFPVQPKASLWSDPQPAGFEAKRLNGAPIQKGDNVWVNTGNGTKIRGRVSEVAMLSRISRERTYSVMCEDGIHRIVYAHNLSEVEAGALT